MVVQTFSLYHKKGYEGHPVRKVATQSRVASKAGVKSGRAVKDVGCNKIEAGAESGAVFGIVLRECQLEAANRPSDGATEGTTLSICVEGELYVKVAKAADKDQMLFVNKKTGEFSGAAGATAADWVECKNVRALDTANNDDIVTACIIRSVTA